MNELYLQQISILFLTFIMNQIYFSKKDFDNTINYNVQEENLIDQVSMILF